jgi:hypothetical protein
MFHGIAGEREAAMNPLLTRNPNCLQIEKRWGQKPNNNLYINFITVA